MLARSKKMGRRESERLIRRKERSCVYREWPRFERKFGRASAFRETGSLLDRVEETRVEERKREDGSVGKYRAIYKN